MKTVSVSSENKDELYQTAVLLFNNIKSMAMAKIAGWELTESVTDNTNKYFLTKYSNGKMWIMAVSSKDSHLYSYGQEYK